MAGDKRTNSVATVEEDEPAESAGFLQKSLRAWELSFLTPKLRFIKTQYGQRFIVNIGGFAVTMICAGCFIYFFLSLYFAKAETQYLSQKDSTTDKGRILKTDCSQVAKVISGEYSLGSTGIWSTNKNYYTQQSVFTFTASEMEADNTQFAQYMTAFGASLQVFGEDYLMQKPWSENLKRMLGFRYVSLDETWRAEFDINFNSLLNPSSRYGAYFTSACGVDFSDSDPKSYLNLDSGVYSYDRRIYAYSEMESDVEDDYLRFQWNFEVQDDAYASKTAFDGKYYISTSPWIPWFGTNTTDWKTYESTVVDVDLDGEDSDPYRLTSAACPAGFSGRYTSGVLTCKLAINKNLAVLAAALNAQLDQDFQVDDDEPAFISEGEELINITQYRHISKRFVSGDFLLKVGYYYVVSYNYLFLPYFDHWNDVCDYVTTVDATTTTCSSTKDSCYYNDFELNFVPTGYKYDQSLDNETSNVFPFTEEDPTVDCKLFAPFYLGPQSDTTVSSCTYDDSVQCQDYFFADGWCDELNNNACCGWDGGDCCESTCLSAEYNCGVNGFACCQTDEACESSCAYRQGDALCPTYFFDDDNYNVTRRKLEVKERPRKTVDMKNLANLGRVAKKNMQRVADIIAIKEYENLPAAVRAEVSKATNKHKNAGLFDRKPEHSDSPGLHSEPRIKTALQDYHTGNGPIIDDEAHRRLIEIPKWYDISDIPAPSPTATFQFMSLKQPNVDTAHKYGYVVADSGNTDFIDSYMCYSKSLIDQSGLCQSLCNNAYDGGFTSVNSDTGTYGGFMASALTFAINSDIGQILVDVGSGAMGFLMAKKIHFIDEMVNGEVKIVGQMAVTDFTETTILTDAEIGATFGSFPETQSEAEDIASQDSYLPCEPAACYCFERFRPLYNSTFVLNSKSERDFVNLEYYELGGSKAHCNDPFSKLVVPTLAPEPLIEKFYECESTTQSDVGTVFGSTLANVGTIQEFAMILLIMFLTQVWFKWCMGKEMESVTKDDDGFELETRRLVIEAVRARKLYGGNVGEALVEVLQRNNDEALRMKEEAQAGAVESGGKGGVEMAATTKRKSNKVTF